MSPLDFLDLEDEEASEEDSEDGIIEEVEIEEENLATKMANLDVGASAAVPIEQGAGRGARWARGQPLRAAGPATAPARADPAPRARLCRPTRVQGVELEEDASESEFLDCEPFVWVPMDEWSGKKETFLSESSGPTRVIENAYDAFRSFWDDSLLSHIVAATNRYARGVRSERFQKNWYETNVDELLVLFAFWMLMGIVKMPTVKSCFSKHIILRAEIYRSLFSEDRYWFLNRAFHFADDSREANDPCNVHHLMGPVLDQLNLKCQANYRLHQDICINKPSTLWKGQIGFKQCKKMKLAQCGTDIYELCESSTGYLWSFVIYTNDRTTTSTFNSSISSIIKLMKPLLNLGHVLYIDNWFNSPMLARYLKRRQTDCVGPVRATRTNVPAVIHETSLHEGEFVASQAGDVMVAALQDCQRLTWLSTFHDASQVQKEGRAGRPSQYTLKLIDDYNHGMGGVDPMDEMLQPYLVKRKQCLERTRKLFKRLLKVSIQNARVLLEQSSATKYSALSFRLALIQSIVNRHLLHVPREPRYFLPRPHIRRAQFPAARLTERHFVRHAAVTAAMRAQVKHRSNLARRQCAWCARHDRHDRQRKKTVYECPQCQVPLCLEVCFEEFHTVP